MFFCTVILILLVIYWILSIIFFIYPFQKSNFTFKNPLLKQLLSTPTKAILDIAHRGGSQESFENTIKAFKHSKSLGINNLEMDVHLTKDQKVFPKISLIKFQQLVVIHDTVLDRLCGMKGKVSDYNFNTFPQYQNEISLHFSNEKMKNNQTNQEQLCLLEEVFKQFPTSLYNIELKDPSDEAIKIFYETVTKNHIDHNIIWGTRHFYDVKKLQELAPHIPVFFPAEGVLKVFICFFFGLLPFVPLNYNSLQIPLLTKGLAEWRNKEIKNWLQYLFTFIFFGLIKLFTLAQPYIISHLKKRGIITILWVLNETEEFDLAIKNGAQGIMTDRPSILKEYLAKNHLSID